MKTISIIPARGGSRGIKRKNLRIISKKPLLYYTVTPYVEGLGMLFGLILDPNF